MSELIISGSNVGNALATLLAADEIAPGDEPSYQLCKTIYLYHPLGAKMAESPISMAQSQQREISIPKGPEGRLKEQFLNEWRALGADGHIHNAKKTSRIYGVSSLALMAKGVPNDRPIDYRALPSLEIAFNVLDPLNTAGSLVLNQDPNSFDFQKNVSGISVAGQPYHRSRAVVTMNEKPIYIGYTNSAFGYVGRSVYQRALFPLKTFIQSLITDDMVTRKAAVLVAKLKPAGSIADRAMILLAGIKRNLIKEAQNGNVISISTEEEIESLNFQNLEAPYKLARDNALKNIATAADMPAKLIENETMTEGFGEGTEDAKNIAKYIDRIREEMEPLYAFFDKIVMHRAWSPEFYRTIQAQYPDSYQGKGYTQAFYEWTNSFSAKWPSLLTEPDSEKVKTDDVKLKAMIAAAQVLLPEMDQGNKAVVIGWLADNMNENKAMFSSPLTLDLEALASYVPPQPLNEPEEPRPFSAADSSIATIPWPILERRSR